MKKNLNTGKKHTGDVGHHEKKNLQIIGGESQIGGIDQIFNEIIEDLFPKLRKGTSIHIQEAHRIPYR